MTPLPTFALSSPRQPASAAPCSTRASRSVLWTAPAGCRQLQTGAPLPPAAAAAAAAARRQRRHPRLSRLRAHPPDGDAADDEPFAPSEEQQQQASDAAEAALQKFAASADLNQLQTALNTAIAAEDWEAAASIRDLLRLLLATEDGGGGSRGAQAGDWRGTGVLRWLAERAEQLGCPRPTGK